MPGDRFRCWVVFPTRVGVNRASVKASGVAPGFPHPRGGEPTVADSKEADAFVFPTRVGVNRTTRPIKQPRRVFSPPAWG